MGICVSKQYDQSNKEFTDIQDMVNEINKLQPNQVAKYLKDQWDIKSFQKYKRWVNEILNAGQFNGKKKSIIERQKKDIQKIIQIRYQTKSQQIEEQKRVHSFNGKINNQSSKIHEAQSNDDSKLEQSLKQFKSNRLEKKRDSLQQKKNEDKIINKTDMELDEKNNATNAVTQSFAVFQKFSQSKVLYHTKQQQCYQKGKDYRKVIDQIFSPLSITETKSIFTYDKVINNNMDKYIKKQKNLLLLAKLQNGTIIGGYSSLGFKETPQQLANNKCFIFSIHQNMKYYKFELSDKIKAKYSVKLNGNVLKLGANQIKIYCQSNLGSSDFNTCNSVFQNKDHFVGVSQFLNINNSDGKYKLESYQIYQLQVFMFQQQIPV